MAGRVEKGRNSVDDSRASRTIWAVRISPSQMWGSGEERLAFRRRSFSMDTYLKSGAIFITLKPSDVGTVVISILAGAANAESVETIQEGELMDHAQRLIMTGLDPSTDFEMVCDAFVEEILRFDRNTGLPLKGWPFRSRQGVCRCSRGAKESNSSYALNSLCGRTSPYDRSIFETMS